MTSDLFLCFRVYAETLQCVYKNRYDCPKTQKILLDYFIAGAKETAEKLQCQTEIRTPCEEENDCVCIICGSSERK